MTTRTVTVRRVAIALLFGGLTMTGPALANGAQKIPPAPPSRSDALTVNLSARVASEPADVRVHARLDPNPHNRALTIEWWNADGVGGSHLISLDGDRSARYHEMAIKGMAHGEYTVTAVLTRSDRTQVRRNVTVIVIGRGEHFDIDTNALLADR